MNFQEFLNKYNGQENVGNTPENTGECVGLVSVWMDNLDVPHEWGNAKDLLVNADKDFFEIIPNTPEAIPQQGDIVVWSGSYNNGPGHTGIATGTGDTNTFECFEQNDPLGSNCHLKMYNYNFVDGWLRYNHEIIANPTAKLTLQTIIPKALLEGEEQDLEIQQIAGLLLDGKRDNLDLQNARNEIKELEENNSRLSEELIVVKKGIEDLTKKLASAKPVEAPETVPDDQQPMVAPIIQDFINWVRKIFGN